MIVCVWKLKLKRSHRIGMVCSDEWQRACHRNANSLLVSLFCAVRLLYVVCWCLCLCVCYACVRHPIYASEMSSSSYKTTTFSLKFCNFQMTSLFRNSITSLNANEYVYMRRWTGGRRCGRERERGAGGGSYPRGLSATHSMRWNYRSRFHFRGRLQEISVTATSPQWPHYCFRLIRQLRFSRTHKIGWNTDKPTDDPLLIL